MNRNILGYVAIGLIALLISFVSTSRLMREERQRTRQQMLSVQMKHGNSDASQPKVRRKLRREQPQ